MLAGGAPKHTGEMEPVPEEQGDLPGAAAAALLLAGSSSDDILLPDPEEQRLLLFFTGQEQAGSVCLPAGDAG